MAFSSLDIKQKAPWIAGILFPPVALLFIGLELGILNKLIPAMVGDNVLAVTALRCLYLFLPSLAVIYFMPGSAKEKIIWTTGVVIFGVPVLILAFIIIASLFLGEA